MRNNSKAQNFHSSGSDTATSFQHHHYPPPLLSSLPPPLSLPTLSKKPRGRPLGSRNNNRYSSLESQLDDSSVETLMINILPNTDIIKTITDFACKHHVSLTILSASGTVTSVTLGSSSHENSAFTLYGPFFVLALTGAYIFNNNCTLHDGATLPNLTFGINLSNSHGQLFSGIVAGRVVAGEDVSITVSTFRNPHIFMHVPESDVGDNNDNNYNKNPTNFNGDISTNMVNST